MKDRQKRPAQGSISIMSHRQNVVPGNTDLQFARRRRGRTGFMPTQVNLRPFLRPGLDVLFVALNPPVESNDNGHYFSGAQSRFFNLLYRSELIVADLPKSNADEIVFGSTGANYKQCAFGVVDLIADLVRTNSQRVRPTRQHVDLLLKGIREFQPRYVCVMHSKVRNALNGHPDIAGLKYGICGSILSHTESRFLLNYFPNGNNVTDKCKLQGFGALRRAL
jgi:G:T/U-mismatch repair DNA glycosylase